MIVAHLTLMKIFMDNTFPIQGRYIIAIWLLPFLHLPGLNFIYTHIDPSKDWYWFDIAYYFYYHSIFTALLLILVVSKKVKWRLMFRQPDLTDYIPAIKLTAFIFVFSIAAAYALFYPLSFLLPEFVNYWFIELPPVIYSSKQQFPILPNSLSFISLVFLAPIIEEFAFRGILLHRWSQKWGTNKAILVSSILFGIVHPDPIGATAFGVAMCVIYLKTQTLVLPIICHAINNLVCWLIEAGYVAWLGPNYAYSIESFRAEWLVGVVAALVVGVWTYAYLNSEKSKKVWRLPKI